VPTPPVTLLPADARETERRSRLTPGTVTVLYVAFAALWILASSKLLPYYVDDPASLGAAETVKGLGFVAVTSVLLYLLLRGWRAPPRARTLALEPAPETRHGVVVFLALLALVPAAGFGVLKLSGPASAQQVLWTGIICFFAVFVINAVLLMLWHQQRRADRLTLLARGADERLRAERRISESDRFARATLDALAMHIAVLDEQGRIISVNEAWREFACDTTGHAATTEAGVSYLQACRRRADAGDSDAGALLAGIERVLAHAGEQFSHEYPCHSPARKRWFVAHVTRFAGDGPVRLVVAHENVTERKLAELDAIKLSRYYSALSKTNELIMRSTDPIAMLGEVCRIAVEHGELELVWVGRVEADKPVVTKIAAHGRATPILDEIFVSTDPELPEGQGPFSLAVRGGGTVVAGDFTTDARTAPWQASARAWSLASVLVCPIRRSTGIWGAIAFYAAEHDYFNADLCRLLEELTADLSFSLDAMETARRHAEAEEQLLSNAKVLESSHEGMFITDRDNRYTMVNRAFCDITGYSREELLGSTPALLKSGEHDETFYRHMWAELVRTSHWEGEIQDRRKNGEVFPAWLAITRVADAQHGGVFHTAIFSDITERKAAERRIVHLASHDLLTDLPNRMLLADRLATAIRHAQRRNGHLAVLFVDLDRFKPVNDVLGHDVGDRLLRAAAARISAAVRASDTVGRVGGDEFVVLLHEIHNAEDAARVAQKIIVEMSVPYTLDDHEMVLTASVGIAVYPEDGTDARDLVGLADTAMFAAKESGRNGYRFYTNEMGARAAQRLSLESELRGACTRGEIFALYQPQLDLISGRIVGVEALARWRHPRLGLVAPARFIPVAEDCGIILEIGEWMLNEACRQARDWGMRGIVTGPVAVNVSAIQFRQSDFIAVVTCALQASGLEPGGLELEVTESVVMGGAQEVVDKLETLHTLGVRLAIDDFGTGYSSLSYLRRFPAQRLKIDQSFVRDLPQDADAAAIARAVVSLGRSLGMSAIAEGVETEQQAAFLRSIGCAEAQGYLYARPMSARALEAWLEARPGEPFAAAGHDGDGTASVYKVTGG
jgi:diguanylate cyclase (GGDEF)-like protein/PAS domain S-box-containing protein